MEKEFVEPAANAALKQKWVEALRSGNYQQAQGYLFNDGAYCCLGVLCKIAGAEMGRDDGYTAYIDEDAFTVSEDLDYRLRRRFRIGDVTERDLVNMNDSGNFPFSAIADWIETHDLETGLPLTTRTEGPAPTPLSE